MDIAIIAKGFVLPKTNDENQFWDNLCRGESLAEEICSERTNIEALNRASQPTEKIKSNLAVFIDEEKYKNLSKKFSLDLKEVTKSELLLLESFEQLDKSLDFKNNKNSRFCISIGNMYSDESFYESDFKNYLKNKKETSNFNKKPKYQSKTLIKLISKAMKKYDLLGEKIVVDAACASSPCAINIACNKLLNHETDISITGGLEANLMATTFFVFSHVDALSKDHCRPFDESHNGIIQGEGIVLFALQRLDDAIREKRNIIGVIKGIGGASDGKTASLFAPSNNGQILSYKRCFKAQKNRRLDYIEAHGTGTIVGDNTELTSLSEFFEDFKIPFGSIKSIYGHTLACAGAIGLLKALAILKYKEIPPSPYFKKFPIKVRSPLFVNRKKIKLAKRMTPLKIGVSSFGFGGANFHLLVEEYKENFRELKPPKKGKSIQLVINAISKVNLKDIHEKELDYFNIPPKSIQNIDQFQILSLMAVFRCLKVLNFHSPKLKREEVSVVCAGPNSLKKFEEMEMRSKILQILGETSETDPSIILREMLDGFVAGNEDSSSGILKNVVAGRASNFYNLNGLNFNIDSSKESFPCGLNIIKNELIRGDFKFIFYLWNESNESKSLNCWAVSTEDYSLEHMLPISQSLNNINYLGNNVRATP